MTATHEVLLVEDNPGDAELTCDALGAADQPPNVTVLGDGPSALAYLRAEVGHEQRIAPDLVLLDLNLPGMSGLEVLDEIRDDPGLAALPVLVFSSSSAPVDVQASYGRHANSYLTKPMEADRYFEVVAAAERFWLDTAQLPRPGETG